MDCTGGWGGSARDHLVKLGIRVEAVVVSAGSGQRTKDGTLGFANTRAQMLWQLREALDPQSGENVALPPDRRLAAELTAATWTLRGEQILVESNDQIRKRLGVSPDRADALTLAWCNRDRALFMQQHGGKLAKEWAYAEEIIDPFDF